MRRKSDRPLEPGEKYLPQGRSVLQIIDKHEQVLASFGVDVFGRGQFHGTGYGLRYGYMEMAKIFVPGLGFAELSVGQQNSDAQLTFTTLCVYRGAEIKVAGDLRFKIESAP